MGMVAKYLTGSQNYGLANSESDKDYIEIYIPTWGELFDDVCCNKSLNEHTKMWDFRNFSRYFLRGDFHPIEILYSVEKWEDIPLTEMLRPYAREIIMANASRFFKNVYGLSRSSLDKGQAKGFSRAAWSYKFLERLLAEDFYINENTFRGEGVCYSPRAIRYDGYPFDYRKWESDMEKLGEKYTNITIDSYVYFEVSELLYRTFRKNYEDGFATDGTF